MSNRKIFIIVATVSLLSFLLAKLITNTVIKRDNEIQTLVGKKIVIDNDTLTIINYSKRKHVYMLKHNTEISMDLAKELLVKE